MTNKIRDKIVQYSIQREAAKISALSSRKIDKYEILQVKKYYHLLREE